MSGYVVLLAQAETLLAVVALIFMLVFTLTMLALMTRVYRPWFQAYMSGVRLSMFDIIGMVFRKTDVTVVVRALVMAHQAGAPLSATEVERGYLQGVDLDKVVLAFIRSKKEGMEVTFQDLVDADMEDRLEEKLRKS